MKTELELLQQSALIKQFSELLNTLSLGKISDVELRLLKKYLQDNGDLIDLIDSLLDPRRILVSFTSQDFVDFMTNHVHEFDSLNSDKEQQLLSLFLKTSSDKYLSIHHFRRWIKCYKEYIQKIEDHEKEN